MRRTVVALAFAIALPGLAQAAPPKGFDARVEAIRAKLGAPGVAIAIVENGKVTVARGYGKKALAAAEPVGPDTIFQIGSVSKAFTAAALATLVDDGKIGWDDRVIDHMPDFRMYDAWVTREMTVRDLLVHRSGLGLGQGDMMMVPATNLSRAETVRRIRYLKPVTSFRSAYAYDNILYIAAGQLIEEVTGKTWEVYVRDRLLRPAGMTSSVTNDPDRFLAKDRAYPHGRLSEIRGMGPQQALNEQEVSLGLNSAPAGAIAASANDMAKWLAIQLAAGKVAGSDKPLFSEASAREMWKPVVPTPSAPLPGALAEVSPQFSSYALGWQVQDYRGHKILSHGGATLGFRAAIVLIPEKNVGIAIMTNSEENGLAPSIRAELLDHYLGFPKRDWESAYTAWLDKRNAEGQAAIRSASSARASSRPSLPFVGLCGDLRRPLVRPNLHHREGWRSVHRLPVDARHERPAGTLRLRHLHLQVPRHREQ